MSNLKFDKIIIIDIECTCCDTEEDSPESEIIEIGACLLDIDKGMVERAKSIYVRPSLSKPNQYCTELTGITWDTLKSAPPLLGACNQLIKMFGTKSRPWASWGYGDAEHFKKECSSKNIVYPFGYHHIDVSLLYMLCNKLKTRIGLEDACRNWALPFEGRPHCGKDDAVMTAKILKHIIDW